jgi:uncharacterized membrane protein YesL
METWPPHFRVVGQAVLDWWDDWVQMAVIGSVWVLCWLTIVLGPPATLGLAYVGHRLAYGESLGSSGLLTGGRRYFLAAWRWMGLDVLVILLVIVNVGFYGQFDTLGSHLVQWAFILAGVLWGVVQFYALPYLMEQEDKSWRIALRNGLFTALAAPGYTLVVAGAAALVATVSIILIVPLFLGAPALVAVLGGRAVRERLATYQVREREMGSVKRKA